MGRLPAGVVLLSCLLLLFLQSPCESVIHHCFFFFFFLFLCPSCSHHVIPSYINVSSSSSALPAVMMSVRHISLFLILLPPPLLFLQPSCDSVMHHCFFILLFLCSSWSHDVSPSYIIVSSFSCALPAAACAAAACESVIYHCFFFFLPSSCSHHVIPSYINVSSSPSALPAVMMSIRHVSLFLLLPLLFLQSWCQSAVYHCFFFFFLCPSCSRLVIPSYIHVSSSSSALPAVMMSVHHISLFLLLPLPFLQPPCDSVVYPCFFLFLCSSCSHNDSIVSSSSSSSVLLVSPNRTRLGYLFACVNNTPSPLWVQLCIFILRPTFYLLGYCCCFL